MRTSAGSGGTSAFARKDALNVVIITGLSLAQRLFAAAIAEEHSVTAVLHPQPKPSDRLSAVARDPLGALLGLPHRMARRARLRRVSAALLHDAAARYLRACQPYARLISEHDINGRLGSELLQSMRPDAVLCLGGPIYSKCLIDSAPLIVNCHTGISPAYNGAAATEFAFANGDFDLCGATVMRLAKRVDGGDVLAHYRPAVTADDCPVTLFIKSVRGCARLCNALLHDLQQGRSSLTAVPQGRAVHYYRSRDWRAPQARAVKQHLAAKTLTRFTRDEELHAYWALAPDNAAELLRTNIAQWRGLHV